MIGIEKILPLKLVKKKDEIIFFGLFWRKYPRIIALTQERGTERKRECTICHPYHDMMWKHLD